MKILDIIRDSASLLGLSLDEAVLNMVTEENEKEMLKENPNIASLFNLVKFSIRELCTNYVPISIRVPMCSSNKKIPISMLNNFIRVQNVSKQGNVIKHKIINRNVVVEEDGEYEVNYLTYPEIFSMFDEIDFLQNLSSDVVTFGLCSYYCLSHGLFIDFEEFHDKYIQKAESIKTLKTFEIPCRRWE